MPKIELPPCEDLTLAHCRAGLGCCERNLRGKCDKDKCPQYTPGGQNPFDALAAAVADAGLRLEFQQQYGPLVEVYYRVHLICGCSGAIVSANGKTPTLALLAAIKAVNEREEK